MTMVAVAAMLVLALTPDAPAGQEVPRYRSSVEAVRVDVEVRDGRDPVRGLSAEDFELRDNGVLQRIEAVAFEDVPLSVLLAFDVSTSVRGRTLEDLKAAARGVVAALRPDDQAALLTFSERVSLLTAWTQDRRRLTSAIDKISASGSTSLRDGVFTALGLRHQAAGRTLVVVFSDGADTSSWLPAPAVVKAARETDAVVYAVTPRRTAARTLDRAIIEAESEELKRLIDKEPVLFAHVLLDRVTEETGGEVLYTDSSRDLPATFARIVAEFKSRYLLSFTPSGAAESGWHQIEVKLKRGKKGAVQARRGYVR